MPRGIASILKRVRALAAGQHVRFTLKARHELAGLDLDAVDAFEVLTGLRVTDFVERLTSESTGEWLYVFTPHMGETVIYVKLILRDRCVVVSFHEDEDRNDEESD
jgi:hypothetical protein